jgi:hypothetical protein
MDFPCLGGDRALCEKLLDILVRQQHPAANAVMRQLASGECSPQSLGMQAQFRGAGRHRHGLENLVSVRFGSHAP